MLQKDPNKTASAARILSPNPTGRPSPCLLNKSFFYAANHCVLYFVMQQKPSINMYNVHVRFVALACCHLSVVASQALTVPNGIEVHFYFVALLHCHIVALSLVALSHCCIVALSPVALSRCHLSVVALSHFHLSQCRIVTCRLLHCHIVTCRNLHSCCKPSFDCSEWH